MRVAVLVTLVSTLALGSAKKINMHCGFSADHSGMIQEPYCCRDLTPAQNNAKANEATDCAYSHNSSYNCIITSTNEGDRCLAQATSDVRGLLATSMLL